ncbi:hypothetical protein BU16DRAFT_555849 [Lophium mytilinum]|uniref:Uncharacterized protein n=1 Tax=Lophium mytilinum TaxID=390894 RepID=A0A6A6R9D1_9PEZI|nr:hypothetical protein BU16DRAFT_555849 [Lophium mytilinum]
MLSRLAHWRRPADHKCVLLGSSWTGKTTLLYKLKTGAVITTIPTIGFNIETVKLGKKEINFWDFGGCDKIAPLARHLLDSESGVLFLVDVTAQDEWYRNFSFELLEMHAKQLLDAGGQYFWVALAKQDLLPPDTRDETVRKIKEEYESRLRALPQLLKWKIFSQPGLSLLEDDHVWQIFEEIHTTLEQQQKKRPGKEKSPIAPTTAMPTDEELRAKIGSEGLTDISAGEFWKLLTTAQLPAWDHRCHLKAGYMIYLDVLSKMGSIWDAVEVFLQQLEQLRDSNPQRFTNTQHRTMTIFWLHHIRLAILRYRDEVNDGALPSAEDFQQVLLYTPSLMNGRIWQPHYTKALLFSPEAKENWCLPDLAPLPDYIPKAPSSRPQASTPTSGEVKDTAHSYRLAQFGFLVVREYMTTNQRRGLIIKATLRALQSMTLQLRATDSSVPAYSETQALFWVQITHAAVAGLPAFQSFSSTSTANAEKKPSLANMTFETFSSLFPDLKDENLWKKYYTAKVWDSVPARMEFKNPDIQPLPNVIGISQSGGLPQAKNNLLNEETKAQPPSLRTNEDDEDDQDLIVVESSVPSRNKDDIELRKALILSQIKELAKSQEFSAAKLPEITTHAHLLYALFVLFTTPFRNPSAAASEAMSTLAGPQIPGLTQKAFWIQVFTAAVMRARRDGYFASAKGEGFDVSAFTSLISHHPQLLFEDLWTRYYSREIWESWDARVGLVEMDRGRLEGFLGPVGT